MKYFSNLIGAFLFLTYFSSFGQTTYTGERVLFTNCMTNCTSQTAVYDTLNNGNLRLDTFKTKNMKIKPILLFSFLFFGQICKANYASKDTLNVLAINGLNIRSTKDSKSKKIGNIKYGQYIIVLNTHDFAYKDTMDNRTGNWIEIDYKGIIGFVFDGYLSKLPVPKINKRKETPYEKLYEYINANFQVIQEPIIIFEPWFDLDGKDAEIFKILVLSHNVKKKETSWYEEWEYKLYFENTRFSELISLFEIFILDNPNYQEENKRAMGQFQSSKNLLTKSIENSEIEILDFKLMDGIKSKTISFLGGG